MAGGGVRSVIFNLFPLEGQRCPEKIAASPGKDFLENAFSGGGRANSSGLSVILSPPALSGRVKDLLFQFCSTVAIERRQRVVYVAATRLVSPPPVTVHRAVAKSIETSLESRIIIIMNRRPEDADSYREGEKTRLEFSRQALY